MCRALIALVVAIGARRTTAWTIACSERDAGRREGGRKGEGRCIDRRLFLRRW